MKRKALTKSLIMALLLSVISVSLFPSSFSVVDVKEENSWTTLAPMLNPRASFDAQL
jgi:hypothetical protein